MGPLGSAASVACSIVLGVTLLVSAAAKWRLDRAELAGLLRDSGVPGRAAGALAVGLPVAEAVVGAALVVRPDRTGPAWVALALLGAFTVFLLVAGAAGRSSVPCPCFGAPSAAGHSAASRIARNGVLLGVAVVATGDAAGARPAGVALLGVPLAAAVTLAVGGAARAFAAGRRVRTARGQRRRSRRRA